MQVCTILLYGKCRVGHCNGYVKFNFNGISLYTKIDSEWRRSATVSAYISKFILRYNY